MGAYKRSDSKFWWLYLEGAPHPRKIRTRIPVGGTATEQRDSRAAAEMVYRARMTTIEKIKAGIELPPIPPHANAPDHLTFATLAEWYDMYVIPHHKGRERERQILPRLIAAFGSLKVTAVTATVVMAWRQCRLDTPITIAHCGGPKGKQHVFPKPSKRTVNREVGLLKQILSAGVSTNKFPGPSPLAGLRNLPGGPIQRRTMSPAEELLLLPALSVVDRAIFLVGLLALVRLGDILDLRRVDDTGTELCIRDPKNGRMHNVPISAALRVALDAVAVDPAQPEWYFPSRRGGRDERARVRSFGKALARACAKAGLPYGKKNHGITFHWATRRTGASRMIRQGGDKMIGVAQSIGNWKTAAILIEMYQETVTDDMRAAVETISPIVPSSPPDASSGHDAGPPERLRLVE